jgi:phage shock protein PspC (stress-responsive transcriptional regulator)
MVIPCVGADDGYMEDTKDKPGNASGDQPTDHQDGFDSKRLRTIADMRRSRDDRMVAGVCSGAAKYLNVDPVVIRVVIAVLTFVGLSGLILYLAAWFFLPVEDVSQNEVSKSIAADWFNLDKNEEQVRIIGLVGAAVLAAVAIVGNDQWAWDGLPWILVPLAVLYWLFVVRPRRKNRDDADPSGPSAPADTAETDATLVLPDDAEPSAKKPVREARRTRTPGSSALTGLTLSVAAIAVAIAVLVSDSTDSNWTTYVAVALGVVAVGLLVGTFFGRPGPLIPIGIVLAAVLAVGSLMPSAGMGEKVIDPLTADSVEGSYEHGLGELRFDLTHVNDVDQLLGSTIDLENGAGDITVTVPHDLNVAIDAQVDGGEIRAFGRKTNGTDVSLVQPADDPDQPALTLHIRQTFGGIEVIER